VAQFIGTPAMNLLPAEAFTAPPAGVPAGAIVGIRPHDLTLASAGAADLRGRVDVCEPLGGTSVLHVRLASEASPRPLVRVVVPAEVPVAVDDSVGLRVRWDRVHRFEAVTGTRVDEAGAAGRP
jgi:ABC-type sugar transport system ATPase subunit